MALEHKDIPNAQLHEPKGVSTATSGTVYVANGVGSGSWEVPEIQGQDAAVEGSIPIKTGSSVVWSVPAAFDPAYVEVDTNEVIRSLTGSTDVLVDSQFLDDYVVGKFTLSGTSSLQVEEDGIYVLHWYGRIKPQSALGASNEVVELNVKVNGTVSEPFRISQIQVIKNAAIDDAFTCSGGRIISLVAGDDITVTFKNLAATRSYKTLVNYNLYRIA